MNRINHEIDLFREYHIRLITDAVTGELDVRGVKLPAPDETEDMANLDIGEDVEVETIDEMEGVDA